MTGSALFDRLISLIDPNFFQDEIKTDSIYKIPQFKGEVLVAEDNETNQLLISVMLQDRGLSYTIVENGQKVIQTVKDKEFDLIFMDINMPILDGINATKILRKNNYAKPIVSLSANVIESDTRSFKEAGMDDILHKPLVPQELDAMLVKYLKTNIPTQEFDTIQVETIAKSLMISEHKVVRQLLLSLKQTLKTIKEELLQQKPNPEILHRLKGAVGNMRLENFYKFIQKIEQNYTHYNTIQKEKALSEVLQYIDNAIFQIKKI